MPYLSACSGSAGDHRFDRGLQLGNLIVKLGYRGCGDGLALTVHLNRHLLSA